MIEEDKNRQEEIVEDRLDKKIQPVKVEPVKVEPEVVEQPMEEPANIFDEYEMKIEAEKEQMPVEPAQQAEETKKEQPNNNSPMYMTEDEDLFLDEDERHKKECKKRG